MAKWTIGEVLAHEWSEKEGEYLFRVSWIDPRQHWEPTNIRLHNFLEEGDQEKLNKYLIENQLNPWVRPGLTKRYGPLEPPEFVKGVQTRPLAGNDEQLAKAKAEEKIDEITGGRRISEILRHRFSLKTQDVRYQVTTQPKRGDVEGQVPKVWIDSYLLELIYPDLLFAYIREKLADMPGEWKSDDEDVAMDDDGEKTESDDDDDEEDED